MNGTDDSIAFNENPSTKDDASSVYLEHTEHADTSGTYDVESKSANRLSTTSENPLANVPRGQLIQDVESFCELYGLHEHSNIFIKGALISQNPSAAQSLPELSDEDKLVLEREHTHKWSQPWQLYFLAGR